MKKDTSVTRCSAKMAAVAWNHWVLVIALVSRAALSYAQEHCPVHYADSSYRSRPVLFGGLTSTSCQGLPNSPGCAPRDNATKWSRACNFTPRQGSSLVNTEMCTEEQVQGVISLLRSLDKEEILSFTPCDLWPYLRGRTLWLIG
jgi:hypothetical protein